MMAWHRYALQDIAPAIPSNNSPNPGDIVWHLSLDNIESHTGVVLNKLRAPVSDARTSTYHFDQSHVLYSKLRPYLNKVVVPDEPGIATTELIPLRPRPHLVCREYLAYYLRSPSFVGYASQYVTGAKMPRVILDRFWQHEAHVPPLCEQHRIVEILDEANHLRHLRFKADAKADLILPALFIKMFGDPGKNPMGWVAKPFRELLIEPPRNGLSPSSAGTFPAKVLTLTAVTGRKFDEAAVKDRYFVGQPPANKEVDPHDFLICRGNGNLGLVGRARFAHRRLDNTVFPDTIIAARVDQEQVDRAYLEALWQTSWMRLQIESGSNTTSGIHKINQTTLGTLPIRLPPIALQTRFGALSNTLRRSMGTRQPDSLDRLFRVLSQRAFSGELALS